VLHALRYDTVLRVTRYVAIRAPGLTILLSLPNYHIMTYCMMLGYTTSQQHDSYGTDPSYIRDATALQFLPPITFRNLSSPPIFPRFFQHPSWLSNVLHSTTPQPSTNQFSSLLPEFLLSLVYGNPFPAGVFYLSS
jgi:hypothetical protein